MGRKSKIIQQKNLHLHNNMSYSPPMSASSRTCSAFAGRPAARRGKRLVAPACLLACPPRLQAKADSSLKRTQIGRPSVGPERLVWPHSASSFPLNPPVHPNGDGLDEDQGILPNEPILDGPLPRIQPLAISLQPSLLFRPAPTKLRQNEKFSCAYHHQTVLTRMAHSAHRFDQIEVN